MSVVSQVVALERENQTLKEAMKEFSEKMETEGKKVKACKFCKNYIQHYRREDGRYVEVCCGHCVSCVPIKKGGKKNPLPDDCCPYFEMGKRE